MDEKSKKSKGKSLPDLSKYQDREEFFKKLAENDPEALKILEANPSIQEQVSDYFKSLGNND